MLKLLSIGWDDSKACNKEIVRYYADVNGYEMEEAEKKFGEEILIFVKTTMAEHYKGHKKRYWDSCERNSGGRNLSIVSVESSVS